MYLGIVKGTIVAERKAAGLEGKKLLLVQPVDERGASIGDLQAAIDTVQAGEGDLVYLVGSREAALATGTVPGPADPAKLGYSPPPRVAPREPWFVPVDAAIVGIVDGIDAADAEPLSKPSTGTGPASRAP